MKKLTLAILGLAILPLAAMAQNTANGSLVVSANVQSSIYLTLENATGGATIANAGTNAATLAFGNVSAYGSNTLPQNVSLILNGPSGAPTSFTLSTKFGVKVAAFNVGTNAGYTLTAALKNAETNNNLWTVDSHSLSTTAATITGATSYGNIVSHDFALQIPTSESAGSISNTIDLVATQQ